MGLLGKQPGIAAVAAVEGAGLAAWLVLARWEVTLDAAGTAVPPAVPGVGILFVALLVGQALTDATVNGVGLNNWSPSTFAVAAIETTLWVAWVLVAEAVGGLAGVAVAGLVLAVLAIPQHVVEGLVRQGSESPVRGLGYWAVPIGFVEALGATVLLALSVEPALVGSVPDPKVLDAASSKALLYVPDAVGTVTDPSAALAGAAALVAFLFVGHNLAVLFTLRTPDESDDGPDLPVLR